MKYSNKKWFIQFRNCLANLVEPGAHSIKTRVAKCLMKWFSVEMTVKSLMEQLAVTFIGVV